MNTAFLSLGGNLGDRLATLLATANLIEQHCGSIIKSSGIYETEPWGTLSEKKYLNQVLKLSTSLTITELLEALLQVEQMAGRKRVGEQYADRTIDIDLLFFNNEIFESGKLRVPHPRLHLRRFILLPFNELEGDLVHPEFNESIHSLLERCVDKLPVNLYISPSKTRNE